MNSILGFAQVLKNDPHVPLTATQRQSVELILSAGDHLLELINDILDLSRIETGKLSISPEIILVDSVIEEVVAIIKSIAVKLGLMHGNAEKRYEQTVVYFLAFTVKANVDISVCPVLFAAYFADGFSNQILIISYHI